MGYKLDLGRMLFRSVTRSGKSLEFTRKYRSYLDIRTYLSETAKRELLGFVQWVLEREGVVEGITNADDKIPDNIKRYMDSPSLAFSDNVDEIKERLRPYDSSGIIETLKTKLEESESLTLLGLKNYLDHPEMGLLSSLMYQGS